MCLRLVPAALFRLPVALLLLGRPVLSVLQPVLVLLAGRYASVAELARPMRAATSLCAVAAVLLAVVMRRCAVALVAAWLVDAWC